MVYLMAKKKTASKKGATKHSKKSSKKAIKKQPVKKEKIQSSDISVEGGAGFPRKKFIRFTVLALLIVFLLFFLAYALNVKVKLLFDTETHITLSPTIASYNSYNHAPVNVVFNVDVQKLEICDISCTHKLVDVSNGIVVKNFSEIATSHKSYSYDLSVPSFGSGQVIYNYNIECETIDKSICPSKNKSYSKSAFITVDYFLSEAEIDKKNTLKENLVVLTTNIESVRRNIYVLNDVLRSLDYYDGSFTSQENSLSSKVSGLNSLLNVVNSQIDELFNLWESQKFSLANEKYLSINERVSSLLKESESAKKSLLNIHSDFSNNLNSLESLNENSSYYSEVAGFLSLVDKQNFEKLKELNNSFIEINLEIKNKSFSSFSSLSFNVSSLKLSLESINSDYVSKLQELNLQSDILFSKYNSTFYLLTGDSFDKKSTSCKTIYYLLDEVNSYNSNVDISSLNNSQIKEVQDYSNILLNNNSKNNISLNQYFIFPEIYLEDYISNYCNWTSKDVFDVEVFSPDISLEDDFQSKNIVIPPSLDRCCFDGVCGDCCHGDSCDDIYPVVLVHGHSFSKSTSPELAFTRLSYLQSALSDDGYINGGTIGQSSSLENITPGTWGKTPAPLVIGVTYYYLNYYDVGGVNFVTRKTDSIENYALRLKESIDLIMEKTGSDKVVIIAHSMGGLVVREYISLFGEYNVDKLIILGTPNYGVEGDVRKYCTITGAKAECSDMYSGSIFLTRLNNPKNYLEQTKTYTIAALGCGMKSDVSKNEEGDGVVLARNVPLPFATNYNITGNCTDFFGTDLHMNFVNPALYPQTYELISSILSD